MLFRDGPTFFRSLGLIFYLHLCTNERSYPSTVAMQKTTRHRHTPITIKGMPQLYARDPTTCFGIESSKLDQTTLHIYRAMILIATKEPYINSNSGSRLVRAERGSRGYLLYTRPTPTHLQAFPTPPTLANIRLPSLALLFPFPRRVEDRLSPRGDGGGSRSWHGHLFTPISPFSRLHLWTCQMLIIDDE